VFEYESEKLEVVRKKDVTIASKLSRPKICVFSLKLSEKGVSPPSKLPKKRYSSFDPFSRWCQLKRVTPDVFVFSVKGHTGIKRHTLEFLGPRIQNKAASHPF